MKKLSKVDLAYNRGLERAAKLAGFQVFETRKRCGSVTRWQVGKAIAEMIRSKKKVLK